MAVKRTVVVLAVAAAVLAAALWFRRSGGQPASPDAPAVARTEFVGAAACRDCHQAEYRAWETSHHRRAMQPAEAGAVLGDFQDSRFSYGRITSTFFQRDGRFMVRTDAADGTLRDFEVKYTFGVDPLQQYLIELPGGRLQALSVAWDSRPKPQGGQRWFHLYPGDAVDHSDELHWTGRQQNWNFMCADCHSTNLRKGYDAAADRFQTTWSDLNVGCEACHGPGSRHVKDPRGDAMPARLTERRNVHWRIDPATHRPIRSVARTTSAEIDACAPCHSRREQIAEGYTAGSALDDHYAPSFLTPDIFHPDGQQRDEVYIHASFLQSRMAHAGVTCSDCHEPHSGRTRLEGNALCAQCHAPAKYDAPAHHFHSPKSAGAACVACHMPETTYMVIDPRRDHSIRVPRPDRSLSLGVPNACSQCHKDRSAAWADTELRKRLGRPAGGFQTFAEAFHTAESGGPASSDALRRIADDAAAPSIVRASALARLARQPDRVSYDAATRHATNGEVLIRRGALAIFENLPPELRRTAVAPLLRDPARSVRLQAAWLLAPVAASLTGADSGAFSAASEELVASLRYRGDRPEERTTLGTFYRHVGRRQEAVAEYRAAIQLAPKYSPPYVNLSDLQREDGAEAEAERTLREGLAAIPSDATLHHALGLSLARSGRRTEAIQSLKRASELADEPRFAYTYAVALHDADKRQDAIAVLERTSSRHPRDRDTLFALATFHRDAGRRTRALEYAQRLLQLYPDDAEAASLVSSLRGS